MLHCQDLNNIFLVYVKNQGKPQPWDGLHTLQKLNIDVINLHYNTSPFLNSGFWSGSLPEVHYCFSERVSQLRKAFPKGVSHRQYKRLDALPKPCSQISLQRAQTLLLTLLSSHSGWHLQQTLFAVEMKAFFPRTCTIQLQRALSHREKSWFRRREEKGQQHLQTSDIPLTDKWAWEQNCPDFCWVPHPSLPHCQGSPAQFLGSMPPQTTPSYCAASPSYGLSAAFQMVFNPPWVTLLIGWGFPQYQPPRPIS